MKKIIQAAASTAVAALALGAAARTFEISAWRGETVAARVPDFAVSEITLPDGIPARLGVMKSVKYAPAPNSPTRLEVFDRIVWNCRGNGPLVIEVSVPRDAKPGIYECGMMRLRVIDRTLPPPKEWKYYLDLWQHPWAVSRIARVKPFSKEHYAAMKPVWELLATAGQKTITVPIVDLPWDHQCADAYHSMIDDPDFRLFDEYVQFCQGCGLGPDIACYSLGPWPRSKAVDPDEMERHWGGKFDRFVAHLKEKGWYDRTVMAMDERAKKGFVTTFYVCGSPVRPNTLMDSGDGEAFWCGAAPAFMAVNSSCQIKISWGDTLF